MRHWYSRLSLRTKVTSITLVITMLSLGAVATIGVVQIGREINAEQHRTADSVALGVARASELAMTVRDAKELSRLANSFLRDDTVLFVAVYSDASNKPLALAVRDGSSWMQFSTSGVVDIHRGVVGTRKVERFADVEEFSADADTDLSNDDQPAESPSNPSQVLGRVTVCISTIPTILAEREQIRFTVVATALAGLIGAAILFLMLRPLMRRLNELARASLAISHGNFNLSINDPHEDEIGRVSQSFEGMRMAVRDRDARLRQFADTLQEQVKQRTAQLEKALAAAEEASRAKSLFLANMSHELRTPLNGVIGMVDLLLAADPNAQQRRYCEVAKASARSLLELINDILDFSKIEAGKLELDATDFDLHEVIENVTQMVSSTAETKQIELICAVAHEVPRTVRGDSTRLRQVVLNLVSNAIKFTETGEVVINASVEDQNEAAATVKLSVKDSGIGIPKERLARLFKSFSQVDASTTRKYGGTGLGLAISHRIVELMGGQIGVESEEGKGSTFWIKVPFEKRPTLAPRRQIGIDPRGLRALVVDDNSANREILQAQLKSWRLQADIACGAQEALQMLDDAVSHGDPYRFAILDMRMPKTDGMELAGEIKCNPRTHDVILISLSSIGEPLTTEQMNKVGFSACLTKPALPSQLYDALVDSLAASDESNPGTAADPRQKPSDKLRLDGVRILLAEDNPVNRFVASELLATTGCTCAMAVNGREALNAALSQEHDIILMDCQMPEMDGFEATRAIREAEKQSSSAKHRPIIALTANAIKGDRELCLAAGMDDYVTKPIDPPELFAAIRRQLPPDRLPDQSTNAAKQIDATPAQPISLETANPPIDLAALQQRCLGNRKLASKALKIFESSLASDADALAASVSKGDAKAVAASAHKLKGSAANVSAEQVRSLAAELEKLGKADALSQADRAVNQLNAEIKRFQEFLDVALKELTPAPGSQAASIKKGQR